MGKRNADGQGRLRSRLVNFHISPEDLELMNKYVAVSGLTKREYIEERIMLPAVRVYGNPRVYKALKEQMEEIIKELKRIESAGELTPDFISLMQFTMTVYDGMKEEI